NRAIMNGETRTGVTTFLLAQKVDTGSILLQEECPINPDDDAGSLHDRLAVQGARIVLNTVRGLEQGSLVPKPQNDAAASPAPKIRKEDCRIDWSRSARVIHNQVRGLSPYPAASTTFRGQHLKIFRTQVTKIRSTGDPGTIASSADSFEVCTGDTLLLIEELRMEGRKRMGVAEFLRGNRVETGVRLGRD
ncbi:MAG: formyltransferase family protein, partial [Ignavibacteria bacterium]|nr:formyltransferase family protein [Ignavibacteria bacterium]